MQFLFDSWFVCKRAFAQYIKTAAALCGLGVLLLHSAVSANQVKDVNLGRVLLEDQSLQSQRKAGQKALEQVFVKISGDSKVMSAPEVSRAVKNFEQYMVSSSFVQIQENRFFEVNFNQQKIENLLLASGLSVWTNLRPSALIWLSKPNDGGQATVLSQNNASDLNNALQLKAFSRGLEILLPIGDLQDQMAVSSYDLVSRFVSRIKEASLRYNSGLIIMANIDVITDEQRKQSANIPKSIGEQTIVFDDTATGTEGATQDLSKQNIPANASFSLEYIVTESQNPQTNSLQIGTVYGTNEAEVVKQLVDIYADNLAQRFALNNEDRQEAINLRLDVKGIDSMEKFIAVFDLIETIPAVRELSFIAQDQDTASLELTQVISAQQLIDILSLDPRLMLDTSIAIDQESVSFVWQ